MHLVNLENPEILSTDRRPRILLAATPGIIQALTE